MIESPINEDDVPGQLDTFDELALTAQFMVRLGALLTAHHCEASPEGWRELAVTLALRYEPTFKDVSPVNQQGSDEPPEFKSDAWANARLLKRQIESRATSQEEAAELFPKNFFETAKLLDQHPGADQPFFVGDEAIHFH